MSAADADTYLKTLAPDMRAALQKLRAAIKAAAPDAEEVISYGAPAFRLGRMLVGYGAAKAHCSFFLMSNTVAAAHRDLLAGYETSTGAVRFSPAKPLPARLVKTLVAARMAENARLGPLKKTSAKAAPAKKIAVKGGEGAAFLRTLDHPLRAEIAAARWIILGANSSINDGIKWNSLSFRTSEWFATVNLRSRAKLQLVMHLGAKARDHGELSIPDPKGLLKWLAKDRALLTLGAGRDIAANKAALAAIVRAWIKHVK